MSHAHLMFCRYVWSISRIPVRRCRSLTSHCQGNIRHYPLQIFRIKTITASFTCGVTTGIPSGLFVCYSLLSKLSRTQAFIMDSIRAEQISRDIRSQSVHLLFCILAMRSEKTIAEKSSLKVTALSPSSFLINFPFYSNLP